MAALKRLGALVLGLLGCARGERGTAGTTDAGTPAAPASAAPAKPTAPREVVKQTIPLELGETDDRTRKFQVWPIDGSAAVELVTGTRIERLEELSGRTKPAGAPEQGAARIRILSGERQGLVGYVHSYEIQAAR